MVNEIEDVQPKEELNPFEPPNYDGMLANHFAGFAMQALISSRSHDMSKEDIAEQAFQYSIAMLEERKKYS